MKELEEANKNLKKELELKNFDINVKNTTIKKKDEQITNVMAENETLRAEVDNLRKGGTKEVSSTCKKCFRKLKTETDLKAHMIEEHKETEKTSYFNFDNSYVESEEENDDHLDKSGNETETDDTFL